MLYKILKKYIQLNLPIKNSQKKSEINNYRFQNLGTMEYS